ncbi:MAG: hypothetical protein CVV32_06140 [Methanomicrobiales archaeon HGW-Methanomicrobiales-3]|nr:MAG: hypothetical protein CVV32_06140 [Methanomicrobiales archaeon HGW-Methanomicrobiales-3]
MVSPPFCRKFFFVFLLVGSCFPMYLKLIVVVIQHASKQDFWNVKVYQQKWLTQIGFAGACDRI